MKWNLWDWCVRGFGGYTYDEMKGLEDLYITERDRDRQVREALEDRLNTIESQLIDIRDRKRIAYSVPDADWNPASMKHTLEDLTARLDKLTTAAEKRRKRSSELAQHRMRQANGRFLPVGD